MFALIFGGSGSGKSEYAEKLSCELAQKNEKYYISGNHGMWKNHNL